jgi:hypothetical protein
MMKLGLLAGICGAAALALASAAGALPLGKAGQGLAADAGLLQPVHGCHADWREDRGGLHRHTRDCRRIDDDGGPRGGRVYEPPPPVYVPPPRRECYYVGPVRVCP